MNLTETAKNAEDLLIGTLNINPIIDIDRQGCLLKVNKEKLVITSVLIPKDQTLVVLSALFKSKTYNSILSSAIILPGQENKIYFEGLSEVILKAIFKEPCFIVTDEDYMRFLSFFLNVYFERFLTRNKQCYVKLFKNPFRGDVCQLIDIKYSTNKALLRVIPRVDILELQCTHRNPALVNMELFDQSQKSDIAIEISESRHEVIDVVKYRGRIFLDGLGFLISKMNNIELDITPDQETLKIFSNDPRKNAIQKTKITEVPENQLTSFINRALGMFRETPKSPEKDRHSVQLDIGRAFALNTMPPKSQQPHPSPISEASRPAPSPIPAQIKTIHSVPKPTPLPPPAAPKAAPPTVFPLTASRPAPQPQSSPAAPLSQSIPKAAPQTIISPAASRPAPQPQSSPSAPKPAPLSQSIPKAAPPMPAPQKTLNAAPKPAPAAPKPAPLSQSIPKAAPQTVISPAASRPAPQPQPQSSPSAPKPAPLSQSIPKPAPQTIISPAASRLAPQSSPAAPLSQSVPKAAPPMPAPQKIPSAAPKPAPKFSLSLSRGESTSIAASAPQNARLDPKPAESDKKEDPAERPGEREAPRRQRVATVGDLVVFQPSSYGAVISEDGDTLRVVTIHNESVDVSVNDVIRIADDNTARDTRGRRVMPGDSVKVKPGPSEASGPRCRVTHTLMKRACVELKGQTSWYGQRQIELYEDDIGLVIS